MERRVDSGVERYRIRWKRAWPSVPPARGGFTSGSASALAVRG
jgi:hypothetical protein